MLTPNLKGFERALEAGVTEVAVLVRVLSILSKKYQLLHFESVERFRPVLEAAQKNSVRSADIFPVFWVVPIKEKSL
ncbi:MAG: hypothetical protein Ct9H300mP21_08330 [Pseudomonadota bacterium]|nr:MAG: hypothetical protein Ct9H300mP21_08330 [Pseudomonadota bacterium]